jgi:hypothetical protein
MSKKTAQFVKELGCLALVIICLSGKNYILFEKTLHSLVKMFDGFCFAETMSLAGINMINMWNPAPFQRFNNRV